MAYNQFDFSLLDDLPDSIRSCSKEKASELLGECESFVGWMKDTQVEFEGRDESDSLEFEMNQCINRIKTGASTAVGEVPVLYRESLKLLRWLSMGDASDDFVEDYYEALKAAAIDSM